MQPKLIKSILSRKIESWARAVESESPQVASLIRQNTVVMGGAICSMLTNEDVNDYDVYFRTKEAAKAVTEFYLTKFIAFQNEKRERLIKEGKNPGIHCQCYITEKHDPKGLACVIKSAGMLDTTNEKAYRYFETEPLETVQEYFNGTKDENEAAHKEMENQPSPSSDTLPAFNARFITENAITLSDDIQVVTRFYGEPDEILEYFDFTHCKMYYTSWDNELYLTTEALECLINKRLVYSGSKYPICSIFRSRKFIKRGWNINVGQYLKMVLQIQHLDLQDFDTLREQLVGVDHAYFVEILNLMQKRMDETGAKEIDQTYLVELLDRLF